MGNGSILNKRRYLKLNEIEDISSKNPSINQIFLKMKNCDDVISDNEFNAITYKLLNEKIRKKIIKICSSSNISFSLSLNDLKYFYALLNTTSFEAKLNFLLDFIFFARNKISTEKYINKVNKYFYGSETLLSIFLSTEIIQKKFQERELIYKYVSSKKYDELNKYNLYINENELKLEDTDKLDNNNFPSGYSNRNFLLLNNNHISSKTLNSNSNLLNSNNLTNRTERNYLLKGIVSRDVTENNSTMNQLKYSNKFDYLKLDFQNYEKLNNDVFPITIFQEMLIEMNINPSLVKIIGNYLKLKTQKSFFNFELFKEIFSLLIIEDISNENNQNIKVKEDSIYGLFIILSYPNDYIEKSSLISLIKECKPEFNSNAIQEICENYQIKKHINKDKFLSLFELIFKEIGESLENLKYFQYIFFQIETKNKIIQKNCVNLLLKGNKLQDYIIERLQSDNIFYVIDKNFYDKWNDYVNNNIIENKNINLRIMTNKICDKNGKLFDNVEYNVDYIILSKRLYFLFVKWYGNPIGNEIKREKIFLDENINNNIIISNTIGNRVTRSKNKKNTIFRGEDLHTQQKYELELYPIFLLFFHFEDLLKKNINSFSQIKDQLKHFSNSTSSSNISLYSFSRKTKFATLIKLLSDGINVHLDKNTTRLWIYYDEKFDIVSYEETLEDRGISNEAIVVLESNINNYWPSEKLRKESTAMSMKRNVKNNIIKTGLTNIGNTCYMNSVLQIFLNIKKLKEIFLKENNNEIFMDFIINNDKPQKGELIKEFINLLKEKWIEQKKCITPRYFKEICGEYNDTFKGYDQQDAHDFYTFLVDTLHEDTNIKSNCFSQVKPLKKISTSKNNNIRKKSQENNEIINNENELGNEYWANTVRNNASYFYGMFIGLLKSTLICSECNKSKIKFEPFSSLELPIPEGSNICLEVILFRLPYPLKPLFKNNDNNEESTMKKKIKIKKTKLEKLSEKDFKKGSSNNSLIIPNTPRKKSVEIDKFKTPAKGKDIVIASLLNLNIPLRIKVDINRGKKCEDIIMYLKSLEELNLEKNDKYVEYVIISNDNFIKGDLLVDDAFLDYQKVFIYEILNSEGVKYIFNYNNNSKTNILYLNQQKIENENNNPIVIENRKNNKFKKLTNFSTPKNQLDHKRNRNFENKNIKVLNFHFILTNNLNNNDTYEILVPIIHRYIKDVNTTKKFINYPNFQYFFELQDYIILTSQNSIKIKNLYEVIWDKYMYFLNTPSKFENSAWWKMSSERKYSRAQSFKKKSKYKANFDPFKIKIINKYTHACAFCPWFRFCTGCTLDPSNINILNMTQDYIIVVEWTEDVVTNDINKKNLNLILNHSSINDTNNTTTSNIEKIDIDDCLKLFTRKEEIKDILCEKCNKKTLFTKILEIEKLPRYLVFALKRFKYTLMYTKKLDNLINFPIENLNLKEYMANKKNVPKYNLYGVVNHVGTLTRGHYFCSLNKRGQWFNFDDSYVTESDRSVENPNVYMLIYKSLKHDKKDFYFNFEGLMDTAYKIYIKQIKFEHLFNYVLDNNGNVINEFLDNCQFYYGEPVTIDGNKGYLISIFKENENDKEISVKIKLKNGYFINKIDLNKLIKETVKIVSNKGLLSNNSSLEIYGKNDINNKSKNKQIGEVKKKGKICGGCIIY